MKLNNKSNPLFHKVEQYIPKEINELICSFIPNNCTKRLINKQLHKHNSTTKQLNIVYDDYFVKWELEENPNLSINDFWERSKNIETSYDYKMYIQKSGGGNLISKMENISF
jgi:hypothetical protein